MSLLAYFPVALYFLLELARKLPQGEQKHNQLSSFLIAVANLLMILLPTWIHFAEKHHEQPFFLWAGITIGLAGVGIRGTAMKTLGRFFSRFISIQESHSIIRRGWYRHLRHPGYLGTLLIFFGFSLSLGSWLGVAINLFLFFATYSYRMQVEERMMLAHFGNSYRQYQKETYKILPFLY